MRSTAVSRVWASDSCAIAWLMTATSVWERSSACSTSAAWRLRLRASAAPAPNGARRSTPGSAAVLGVEREPQPSRGRLAEHQRVEVPGADANPFRLTSFQRTSHALRRSDEVGGGTAEAVRRGERRSSVGIETPQRAPDRACSLGRHSQYLLGGLPFVGAGGQGFAEQFELPIGELGAPVSALLVCAVDPQREGEVS